MTHLIYVHYTLHKKRNSLYEFTWFWKHKMKHLTDRCGENKSLIKYPTASHTFYNIRGFLQIVSTNFTPPMVQQNGSNYP